jgi:hypothetical protein
MNKKELVEHARDAGAADEIIQVIQEMPERQHRRWPTSNRLSFV